MSDLQGAAELRARLKAIRNVGKPVLRRWAEDTQRLAQQRVRVRTGRTRASIKIRQGQKTTKVVADWPARVLEQGAKAHTIKPKRAKALAFGSGGNTVFARKAERRATPGRPFLKNSAREVLNREDMAAEVIKLWDDAA